jgi:hypothetical protein
VYIGMYCLSSEINIQHHITCWNVLPVLPACWLMLTEYVVVVVINGKSQ